MAGKIKVGVELSLEAQKYKAELDAAAKANAKFERDTRAKTREVERNFKMVTIAMAKVTAAIIAIKVGWEAYGKVMSSTNATADKFEEIMEGLRQGVESVKRSIVTFDFKDLIKNFKDAVDEGRRYAATLDDIDEETRALKIAESDANDEIIKQKLIQNNATKSLQERIKAGKRIVELEKELTEIRLGIADQAYRNELKNIASITHLTEEEVEAYMRGDGVIVAKIKLGESINAEIVTREKLRIKTLQGIKLTDEESKLYRDLLVKQKEGLSTEEERLAFAAKMMATDDKLNLAVAKYVELGNARRSGDENTLRVQTKLNTATEKSVKGINEYKDALDRLNSSYKGMVTKPVGEFAQPTTPFSYADVFGKLGHTRTLANADAMTEALERQKDIAQELTGVFDSMFSHMDEGFKGMMKALIDYFKMLAVKLAALAATYLVLSMIPGFSEFLELTGGFKKFVGGGLPGGRSTNIGKSIIAMNMNFKGELSGHDILYAGNRYGNILTSHT
jgi:hypothetical protein